MIRCPYCGADAVQMTGEQLWPSMPRLAERLFWRCHPCDAHVGCHPWTTQPLGSLANKALRSARVAAHQAFDPLWQSKRLPRKEAYAWLAERLGIPTEECHIGEFSAAQCKEVVRECREFSRKPLP